MSKTNTAEQKATQTPAKSESKRRILTVAERVAKAERELAELKAKAQAKNQKRIDALLAANSALLTQISERQAKLDVNNLELDALGYVAQPVSDQPSDG